jgi:hypothetical protein
MLRSSVCLEQLHLRSTGYWRGSSSSDQDERASYGRGPSDLMDTDRCRSTESRSLCIASCTSTLLDRFLPANISTTHAITRTRPVLGARTVGIGPVVTGVTLSPRRLVRIRRQRMSHAVEVCLRPTASTATPGLRMRRGWCAARGAVHPSLASASAIALPVRGSAWPHGDA